MNKYKEYTRTRNGVVSVTYRNQKASSKTRGHKPPSYSFDDLRFWMFHQKNFEVLYLNWVNLNYKKDIKPSCDRINDYKPYTLANLRLTTWEENRKKHCFDRKNGINNKGSIAVYRINNNGDKKHYNSMSIAARDNNILKQGISLCCSGKRKISGGFKWILAN